jgi:hypothetical protein
MFGYRRSDAQPCNSSRVDPNKAARANFLGFPSKSAASAGTSNTSQFGQGDGIFTKILPCTNVGGALDPNSLPFSTFVSQRGAVLLKPSSYLMGVWYDKLHGYTLDDVEYLSTTTKFEFDVQSNLTALVNTTAVLE